MRTLVLGAYGHYGKIICQKLKEMPGVTVIGAGKRKDKLASLSNELDIETFHADWRDKMLAHQLHDHGIHLVIHTAGPFVEQDYSVAEACIEAGCYYIDMADDREFVKGIKSLNEKARSVGVSVISGMGMMALNDAILEMLKEQITDITHCEIGVSGSGRLPGAASVRTVLSYCGKKINYMECGQIRAFTGLTGRSPHYFKAGFGRRDLINLDAPDLDILTHKYGLKSFRYQGGYGLRGQGVMSVISNFASFGWIQRPAALTTKLMSAGKLLEVFSRGKGALFIEVEGRHEQRKMQGLVEVHAFNHQSQLFPVAGILALCQRLMNDFIPAEGAYPAACGLVSIHDISRALGPEVKFLVNVK